MCKLSVLPIVLENDLLKVDKILGLNIYYLFIYWEYLPRHFRGSVNI